MTNIPLDTLSDAILTHSDPVVTASELADTLDCSRRHILNQLRLLEHAGDVESKEIGARAVAWWHVKRVRPPHPHEGMTNERRANSERTANEQRANGDEIAQAVEAAAANWDDSDDRLDARKAAARAVLSALRERGMSKSEIIEEFYSEYPVDGQSEDTWWRKNIAECNPAPLKQVADYNPGTQKWEM